MNSSVGEKFGLIPKCRVHPKNLEVAKENKSRQGKFRSPFSLKTSLAQNADLFRVFQTARLSITSQSLPPVFKQQRHIGMLDRRVGISQQSGSRRCFGFLSGNPHREKVPLWKLSRNQSRRISYPPSCPLNSKGCAPLWSPKHL